MKKPNKNIGIRKNTDDLAWNMFIISVVVLAVVIFSMILTELYKWRFM